MSLIDDEVEPVARQATLDQKIRVADLMGVMKKIPEDPTSLDGTYIIHTLGKLTEYVRVMRKVNDDPKSDVESRAQLKQEVVDFQDRMNTTLNDLKRTMK